MALNCSRYIVAVRINEQEGDIGLQGGLVQNMSDEQKHRGQLGRTPGLARDLLFQWYVSQVTDLYVTRVTHVVNSIYRSSSTTKTGHSASYIRMSNFTLEPIPIRRS